MTGGELSGYRASPLWRANGLVFLLLLALTTLLFLFQLQQTRSLFLEQSEGYATLLARVALLHVENAEESQRIMDRIIQGHLSNIASFIAYLDGVEPFSSKELEAFAHKTGLWAVALIRQGKTAAASRKEWLKAPPYRCGAEPMLIHDSDRGVIVLLSPMDQERLCVLTALPSGDIDELQARIGIDQALKNLRQVPGILEAKLVDSTGNRPAGSGPAVSLTHNSNGAAVVVITVPLKGADLQVELDARGYQAAVSRLWRNFLAMALAMAIAGALLSLWLYRRQRLEMERAVRLEQSLASQREEAMIGRAAGAIAHEVRNPLNGVHMALQRLEREEKLSPQGRRICAISLQALGQANAIITGLLEFSRPICPDLNEVDMAVLVREALELMGVEEKGIEVDLEITGDTKAHADPTLMRRVLLNLLQNVIEAQPNGGHLQIAIKGQKESLELRFANGGAIPSEEELQRIMEPYFTTRSSGTGLGLPICKKIVSAHGGRFQVALEEGRFVVTISLPTKEVDSQ